jgi:hypothetical protein
MLKKSASGVLASFRGSGLSYSEVGNTSGAFPFAKTRWKGERPHTMCGTYLLASSLAGALLGTLRVSARQGWAGEMSGLFEHPAYWTPVISNVQISEIPVCTGRVSVAC